MEIYQVTEMDYEFRLYFGSEVGGTTWWEMSRGG